MITIKTNHGDISVKLFDEKAPLSCENFRQYVTDGHFNGTIFHRVIPNFMIQCGGMDENMDSNNMNIYLSSQKAFKKRFGNIYPNYLSEA